MLGGRKEGGREEGGREEGRKREEKNKKGILGKKTKNVLTIAPLNSDNKGVSESKIKLYNMKL